MYSDEVIKELESYHIRKIEGELDYHNHPIAFLKMPVEHQKEILDLIRKYLIPIKTINERYTSYGLKHQFEKLTSFGYIGNGEMKGAMIVSGFKVKATISGINHCYNISLKSIDRLYEDAEGRRLFKK